MFFMQAEVPCTSEVELEKWWALADRHDLSLSHCNGQLILTGKNLTKEQTDDIMKAVELCSTHSVFIQGEPN